MRRVRCLDSNNAARCDCRVVGVCVVVCMKRFLVAGLGALACVGAPRTGAAADLPVTPLQYRPAAVIFNWTGIYLGAHVGGGWVRKDEAAVPFTLAGATVAPAPVVAAPIATQPIIYRYVYEPDRILVIDPATNIAVQAIPR